MEKQANRLVKAAKSKYREAKRIYTCRSLKDLIKAYRACTTSAEERALVKKESAHIRDLFKEGDTAFRRRNISKLLFFHMNGFPTNFGMTECIKLCASDSFADKRVAYLGLMILVDETEDILMLVTNSLKRDLSSTDQHIVGLALTVLGDLASEDMARDLLPDVEKHLDSNNSYIRKKAVLAAVRAVRKLPTDETDVFLSHIPGLFDSHVSGAHIAGTALIVSFANCRPSSVKVLQSSTSSVLLGVLRDLLIPSNRSTSSNISVSGIRNPFMQVRTMHALRSIGIGNAQDLQENIADILAQVASNTDGSKISGAAVLFECVRTIIALNMPSQLQSLAVTILGKFLSHKDPNVRHVGLQELVKVVNLGRHDVDIEGFRKTITDCLQEPDPTIKRRAVELLYAIASSSNSAEISKELIGFMSSAEDDSLREDTCRKICSIADRFSPSHEWHCEIFFAALQVADTTMPESLISSFLGFVSANPPVQSYVSTLVYRNVLSKYVKLAGETSASALSSAGFADPSQAAMESTQGSDASHHALTRDMDGDRKPRLERLALYLFGEYGVETLSNNGEMGELQAHEALSAVEALIKLSETSKVFSSTSLVINAREDLRAQEIALVLRTALSALAKIAVRLVHGVHVDGSAISSETHDRDKIDSSAGALLSLPSSRSTPTDSDSSRELVPKDPSLNSAPLDGSRLDSKLLASLGVGNSLSLTTSDSQLSELWPSSALEDAGALFGFDKHLENDDDLVGNRDNVHPIVFRAVRILASLRGSSDTEVQQRACEYSKVLSGKTSALGIFSLCKMPVLDMKSIRERMAAASSVSMDFADPSAAVNQTSSASNDLLALFDESDSSKHAKPSRLAIGSSTELLALPSSSHAKSVSSKPGDDLDITDLLNANGNKNVGQNGNAHKTGEIVPNIVDSLSSSRAGESSVLQTAVPPSEGAFPSTQQQNSAELAATVIVLDNGILSVVAHFSKDLSIGDEKTRAEFCFTNKSSEVLSKFLLQLSVPRYMSTEMKPASSSTLSPQELATQEVILVNSMHGTKPVQVRYRVQYTTHDGEERQEQGVISGIPRSL